MATLTPGAIDVATAFGTMTAIQLAGAPVFVFVHGLGGAKHLFADAVQHAAARGLGLVAVDLPGFGDSARLPDGQTYTVERHAHALTATLDALGVGAHYLAVHSMSGALLPALLSSTPDRILGIALLEANLTAEDAGWSGEVSGMTDETFTRYSARLNRHAHRILALQLQTAATPERVAEWATCFTKMDRRAFRETAASVWQTSNDGTVLPALVSFTGPKTYYRGTMSPPWHGQTGLTAANTSYTEIPGAGHYLFLDQPTDLYGRVFGGASTIPALGQA